MWPFRRKSRRDRLFEALPSGRSFKRALGAVGSAAVLTALSSGVSALRSREAK